MYPISGVSGIARCVGGLLVAIALVPSPARAAAPNLIAIVTDDQGRWAMGAYGNEDIETPNMDRIASEGALFTNAFVATPVCSPSRATYLTGLYPTEHGIADWIAPVEAAGGAGVQALTWPRVLRDHGYSTGLIGKWHLGSLPEFHPTRHGLDHFFGFLGGGSTPMDPRLEFAGKEQTFNGSLPDILTDNAIEFVKTNRKRPFALLIHFRAPHTPYLPVPEADEAPYREREVAVPDLPGLDAQQLTRQTRAYYSSVHSVDRNIGRLLAALDEFDIASNTLVLFTSDHGYNLGRHRISTKGNGHWIVGGINGPKVPNMWDSSVRVPLAVRWPGVVQPGTVIDDMVSNVDMFRTVLGALEVDVPDGCRAHGIDYSPRLRGRALPPRDGIFGQYDLHNGGLAYMRMVRTARYKYVRYFHAHAMDLLYDLEKDPGEQRNLLAGRRAAQAVPAETIAQLQTQLDQWMKSIDDPLLKDNY